MNIYKKDFPIFQNTSIIFLDSAASTQKPRCVIQELVDFYSTSYANVHRGSCDLANTATQKYENARQKVADFIHAPVKQIIFTKGATESINLVANGFSRLLKAGDEVLISESEHHANFVPWQQACLLNGAIFKAVRISEDGQLDISDFKAKLSKKTKIVSLTHLSNVLGVKNPIEELTELAHNVGAMVLIDGSQSIAHMPIDVQALNCDFFVFSGHKLYGPTGIGVLYGKKEALNQLPPYQYGGDMIKTVSIEETTFSDIPNKFEAGTPPFVEAVGLGVAIDYLNQIGMKQIEISEKQLTHYLLERLTEIPSVSFIGTDTNIKQGIVSFVVNGIHPSDIAFALGKQHICVRVGHHCAMPIHECFKSSVSLRVSLGLYNDTKDIDAFIAALKKAITLFE